MLNATTVLKRKNKTKVEKKRELFVQMINSLEEVLTRSHLLFAETGIDYSSYDEKFMTVIDCLIFMHFGQECFDLISWYLYDRISPDGTQTSTVKDENGNEVKVESAYDLYDLVLRVNPNL
jgi:hypothetical protein